MKTLPIDPSTRNALEVAIDSAIEAQDLLLGAGPEETAMAMKSLSVLGCYKSYLALRPNLTEILVLEQDKAEIFMAIDALLDEQRQVLEDPDDEEHRAEIAGRVAALETLYAHLNPLNPFKP